MSTTCLFFNRCGGCKFDFASNDYRAKKMTALDKLPHHEDPIWIEPGHRRRAEFSFTDGQFGFLAGRSKDIIPIDNCPLLSPKLNEILPRVSALPWVGGGTVLLTECANGIAVDCIGAAPYFSHEFKNAAADLPAIRVSWNGKVVTQSAEPYCEFSGRRVPFAPGAFLQPSLPGEEILQKLVSEFAGDARRVLDLFCGSGTFTFMLKATGYDIETPIGISRDLYKNPLKPSALNQYDCVVMDPPRVGAEKQSIQLSKSTVSKVVYVSCNMDTFLRDAEILQRGGFSMQKLIPIDQFPGSTHWELAALFLR